MAIENDRLDHCLNIVEVKDLLVRERYYRDTAKWTELRNCYHPDPTKTKIDISWYCGDIEGFVSKSRDMAVRGVQGKHEIIPAEIHFNSSHVKAVSESIGTLRVPVNLGDISHHLTAHMRFLSTLEKHGNDWRLLSFEAIYDSDCLTPGFPTQKTLSSEPSQDSRSSYRITTRVLEQLGLTINQDLLGTDRPEAIEDAMKRYFSWLHC